MTTAALAWTDDLALNHPQLDATHAEFVELLAACTAALPGSDAELLPHWDALVAHTEDHFAMEDRWMAATDFGPQHCHTGQHTAVLQIMRECARQAKEPTIADFEPMRVATVELATWFPQHAATMDAGLVQYLAAIGFDPDTGTVREPALAEAGAEGGCGHGAGHCG
jgi:hemerythrin-like metal-binding protein